MRITEIILTRRAREQNENIGASILERIQQLDLAELEEITLKEKG